MSKKYNGEEVPFLYMSCFNCIVHGKKAVDIGTSKSGVRIICARKQIPKSTSFYNFRGDVGQVGRTLDYQPRDPEFESQSGPKSS